MVDGSLFKGIMLLSLPLVLSNVLQVLFNMADVAVVGRFGSAEALGSVGSTTTLVTLYTGFLIGLGVGINIITAQFLGAKRDKDVSQTVHTSFLLALITGVLIWLITFVTSKPMLMLLNTKDDLLDGAVLYVSIYAIGMPAMAVFNCGNGILSADGDTKSPLTYLTVAGVLNVLLNLLFVITFNMSVAGVAIASVISQYLSAILVTAKLFRVKNACRMSIGNMHICLPKAKKILSLGLTTGFQYSVFAIANLFIQASVNSFDTVTVEGNAAAANTDILIYDIMGAFYTACASFMGQNHGAGKKDRVKKSYYVSTLYSFLAGLIFGVGLVILGREFLSLFTKEPAVVEAGMRRQYIMGFSYCISAFMDCTIAASRSMGKSLVPTVIVILGSCVFRVVWVYTVFAYFHTIESLYLLYAFSWTITAGAEIIYFFKIFKKQNGVIAR